MTALASVQTAADTEPTGWLYVLGALLLAALFLAPFATAWYLDSDLRRIRRARRLNRRDDRPLAYPVRDPQAVRTHRQEQHR